MRKIRTFPTVCGLVTSWSGAHPDPPPAPLLGAAGCGRPRRDADVGRRRPPPPRPLPRSPRAANHDLDLSGDAHVSSSASGPRASYAWTGSTIRYYETIPAQWDWSLTTAVSKWNASGGGIRFVRTSIRSHARLTIAFGNIGNAAGKATVGRTSNAWVRLNSVYRNADSVNAHNRIEVMAIFAHELGHVLGFQHTSGRCSTMSAMLHVDGLRGGLPGPRRLLQVPTIDGRCSPGSCVSTAAGPRPPPPPSA